MILEIIEAGPFMTNTYVAACEDTKEAMIIDPTISSATRIFEITEIYKLNITIILNTHGHIDHITDNARLKKDTEAELLIHQSDSEMLNDPQKMLDFFGINYIAKPSKSDRFIDEGDSIKIGNLEFRVIHTPGHSPGGVCLYSDAQSILFSGDTLFQSSIGRTDLPGGDTDTILSSIRDKLLVLPDSTKVYPGHGPSTTIGEEKQNNPYL